jgi:NAD-dependent dihydropyrimidine dehydrogenase PreA subunit
MVYIDDTVCNGCGDCVDVCPTGALVFQNDCAFIHQDLCEGCEICIDACPQGAILTVEAFPVKCEPIEVLATVPDRSTSLTNRSDSISIREVIFPAISSALLWTGRELVPRLADVALGYLDQRIQSSQSAPTLAYATRGGNQFPKSTRGCKQVRNQRRRRKNNRF